MLWKFFFAWKLSKQCKKSVHLIYHMPRSELIEFFNFFAHFLAKKNFYSNKNYTMLIYRSRRFFRCITCPSKNFLLFRFLVTLIGNCVQKNFHSKKQLCHVNLQVKPVRMTCIACVSTNFCQFQGWGGVGSNILN